MMDDRDWWQADGGAHYKELAVWLREVAGRCRLPYPRRELLSLAIRYDRRANKLDRATRRAQIRRK